jgi:hypothetical protein
MSESNLSEIVRNIAIEEGREIAREKARRAGVALDEHMNVKKVDGDASEIADDLEPAEDRREFYMEVSQEIIDSMEVLYGYQEIISLARETPLKVDQDGDIRGYYGPGRVALEILLEKVEEDVGKEPADSRIASRIEKKFGEERDELLPTRVSPYSNRDRPENWVDFFKGIFGR